MLLIGTALTKLVGNIGHSGEKILYSAIDKTAATPDKSKIDKVIGECFDNCFGCNKGAFGFILQIFFITLVCLLSVLSIYTYSHKGILDQFSSVGFARQFLFQGFLGVYIIIFLMYSYYPRLKHNFDAANAKGISRLLFQALLLNAVLFILLATFTHVVFYIQGWSGHTSVYSIIRSVGDVLVTAIVFKSLYGVYLYAVLVSLFPVFLLIFIRLLVSSESFSEKVVAFLNWLHFKSNPLTAITVLFTAVFSLLLSLTLLAVTTS